ncbi:MAG: DUF1343 domain-containing protein [Verrucomicrobia bacterium]|nr:DUF1343 domain-containing protein [Verrucomicrobiota bacterium]
MLTNTNLLALLTALALLTPPCPAAVAQNASLASPETAGLHPAKLSEIDAAIAAAIADQRCPGAVLWFEHRNTVHHRAYGQRATVPTAEPMTCDTVFDAASLTKVVATTPAILLLIERGSLDLDDQVSACLPEFTGAGREQVRIRHLLTHTSGLRPGISAKPDWLGYDRAIQLACAEIPTASPGTVFRYSDVNFILLGEIVRQVGGQTLDRFVREHFYLPLKMADTRFLPPASQLPRIAPTTREGDSVVRGMVHDPTARRMGGVAGHAGLFTTAADLARFSRMLLNEGELDGVRVLKPSTVRLMVSVQTAEPVPDRRGLGWDIDSGYAGPRGAHFPVGSYGHTGWTGTSLWIDPFSRTFVILLSNRNHPSEEGSVVALRRVVGTLAAEAVADFNFLFVPGALARRPTEEKGMAPPSVATVRVLNGVDVLRRDGFAPLRGLRVGLITNHTGHDRDRQPLIDLLWAEPDVQLKVLFSPEHGIRGQLDEGVGDSTDARTGLPVYSLYGQRRKPGPDQLADLDALVFDIQDIGCRFYTYISTLGLCLEAAAEQHLKFFVLDRVNPINGTTVEGPVHTGESSFTAFHALPVRHGMTVGELARMFNAERGWHADLTVVPLENWRRNLWFDQTLQPWTNPSPNMRNLNEATLYPGVGLLESALSVGRGTDTPFEVIGAPYIDDRVWAEALNRVGLPGVRFVPTRFTPNASVFQGQTCGGVQLIVTDRDRLKAVELGIALAVTLQRLYPGQFALDKVQTLLRHAPTIEAIRSGQSVGEITRLWLAELESFNRRRQAFLLYP